MSLFDAALMPETCPACRQRVARVEGRCPVCATQAERARAAARPAAAVPPWPRLLHERPTGLDASGAHEVAALRRLARRVARLSERCAAVPPPLDLLEEGDRATLVLCPAAGEPVRGRALDPGQVWAIAAELARLEGAVRTADLALEPRLDDVRFDADSGRVTVLGLERLHDGLGWDPRLGAVAWGELVADLLGAPRGPGGVELEAVSDRHPPALLAAVRAALGGAAPAEALAGALELAPVASPASDVRAAAAREVPAQVWPDDAAGPFLVVQELPAPPGAHALLALDLRLDRVVRLELPAHAPGDDVAAVVARRRLFAEAEGDPARVVHAAPLDPALRRARAPVLRRGEPVRVRPLELEPAPTELVVAPPPPPALSASAAGELRVTGLPPGAQVVVVRARPGAGTLLVPTDGDVVATAEAGADGAVTVTDPAPGERYAAFPLVSGRALPPGRASTLETIELDAVTAAPRIGAIEVAWRAPAGALVVVRHGPAPIAGPADGELLYWGRERSSLLQDCLDPDQRVHYRAFALGPRGTLSPGLAADAAALGPPPALGAVRATPDDRKVTLAWTWPEGRSYDRALVRREPAWPEGERVVPRGDAPSLVDEPAPVGVALTYELRAALGTTASRRETRVTTRALAELAGFRALPGGRSVVLELSLPPGLPPGAAAQVVRNTDREPRDMDDGSFVRLPKGAARHVDEPLTPGQPVHYRAGLVVDGVRSPGLLASATPLERAGQLSGVEAQAGRGCLTVRFVPPAERCERVEVLAGPSAGELRPVPCDAAAHEVRVEAPPGEPWTVRLLPVHQGNADPSQAVEVVATAWDDASGLTARPAPSARSSGAPAPPALELTWTPPAAPPRAYRLRRAVKGKPDETTELPVEPGAARVVDADVVARRSYVYTLSCRWGPEGQEVETAPQQVEATAWAAPPDLDRPEVRSIAGGVQVSWLPCAARDRVHWDGVAVLVSDEPADALRAKLEGRLFAAEEAAGLGLTVVDTRRKGRAKETLRLAPPPEGTTRTYVVASLSGPLHRAVLVAAAVGLPEGFLALRVDAAAAVPTVAWDLPAWLRAGRARLERLSITRGLEDAHVEGLDPAELQQLSQPWRGDLDPAATHFSDEDALAFVSWGYALEATLELAGQEVVVPGPRSVVPRCQGGNLVPSAEQPRGFFGGARPEVVVRFALEAGKTNAWPPFDLTRGIVGQTGAKVVWSYPGGPPPPPHTDKDVAGFTAGMSLVYAIKLKRARDGLGFTTGEARVTLG